MTKKTVLKIIGFLLFLYISVRFTVALSDTLQDAYKLSFFVISFIEFFSLLVISLVMEFKFRYFNYRLLFYTFISIFITASILLDRAKYTEWIEIIYIVLIFENTLDQYIKYFVTNKIKDSD